MPRLITERARQLELLKTAVIPDVRHWTDALSKVRLRSAVKTEYQYIKVDPRFAIREDHGGAGLCL